MRRARSGNLTALLVVVSVLEFVVNRLAARLFFPRPALSAGYGSHTIHAISVAGPFLFQLTAFLALAVMVAAFVGLFLRGELYPRAIKFSTIVFALFFSLLCAWAVFSGRIDPRPFAFVQTGYAFLALLTAAAFALGRSPVRLKIGVAMFALPGALHAFGYVATRSVIMQGGAALTDAGEIALLLAGMLAPVLLPPRPLHERRWRRR